MASAGVRVLSNLTLPQAQGYSLRAFRDYLPGGPDPSMRDELERRNLSDILPLIPRDEQPDVLILSSPEYLPIPPDIASFPGVKILLITDWNVCLRFLPDLCPLFDFCFTDLPGFRLLRKAGADNIHHQPLFGHDPAGFHFQGKPRNLDVSFCGNLNVGLHRDRNRLLARLAKWSSGRPVHLGQAFGEAYLDVLNRSRLVFNYSIRGEANMRLYEAMACGAVPLVEASNLEAPLLFQEGRHYFRYEPGCLEETLESLLADPARIQVASAEAMKAVAGHTKAEQIRSLLDFAGRERPRAAGQDTSHLRIPGSAGTPPLGNTEDTQGNPLPNPAVIHAGVKALVKLRVLGAAYTMPEAISELQRRASDLPGLDRETLPASLLSILESNPTDPLASAEAFLERMLDTGSRAIPIGALFRMRLHALRGRWPEALEWSRRALESLDSLNAEAMPMRDLYGHFYPPVELGKGFNTDLNRAYREDLDSGSRQGYLDLIRSQCLAGQARAFLALERPREAAECSERIPRDRFVSLDVHGLLAEAYLRLGDIVRLRAMVDAWIAEKPLDAGAWEKIADALRFIGDKPALITFLKEILVLGTCFLPKTQVDGIREVLERERGSMVCGKPFHGYPA
ncbi:MAG: glycosyltransferase [Fibrobacterota bacterium]|nr:glycosyltransferase [Fibrobacterota bacterium]